jgi:hypothetical protein
MPDIEIIFSASASMPSTCSERACSRVERKLSSRAIFFTVYDIDDRAAAWRLDKEKILSRSIANVHQAANLEPAGLCLRLWQISW